MSAKLLSNGTIEVRNTGKSAAISVRLVSLESGGAILTGDQNIILLTGESRTISYRQAPLEPNRRGGGVGLEAFNLNTPLVVG